MSILISCGSMSIFCAIYFSSLKRTSIGTTLDSATDLSAIMARRLLNPCLNILQWLQQVRSQALNLVLHHFRLSIEVTVVATDSEVCSGLAHSDATFDLEGVLVSVDQNLNQRKTGELEVSSMVVSHLTADTGIVGSDGCLIFLALQSLELFFISLECT